MSATLRAFDVTNQRGDVIDTIYYSATDRTTTARDVRRSLIDHDDYSSAITVTERDADDTSGPDDDRPTWRNAP